MLCPSATFPRTPPQAIVARQSRAVNATFIPFGQLWVMLRDLGDGGVVPLAIPIVFSGAQPGVWGSLASSGDGLLHQRADAPLIPGW